MFFVYFRYRTRCSPTPSDRKIRTSSQIHQAELTQKKTFVLKFYNVFCVHCLQLQKKTILTEEDGQGATLTTSLRLKHLANSGKLKVYGRRLVFRPKYVSQAKFEKGFLFAKYWVQNKNIYDMCPTPLNSSNLYYCCGHNTLCPFQ